MKHRLLCTILAAGLPWLSATGRAEGSGTSPQPRTITADWTKVKGPRSEMFRECIGAGRAAEGLRADWQRQLKLCQEEIGFKSIRFHGLLHDGMGVYAETRDGKPRHSWQ